MENNDRKILKDEELDMINVGYGNSGTYSDPLKNHLGTELERQKLNYYIGKRIVAKWSVIDVYEVGTLIRYWEERENFCGEWYNRRYICILTDYGEEQTLGNADRFFLYA